MLWRKASTMVERTTTTKRVVTRDDARWRREKGGQADGISE
jgi:hypothetical protein